MKLEKSFVFKMLKTDLEEKYGENEEILYHVR